MSVIAAAGEPGLEPVGRLRPVVILLGVMILARAIAAAAMPLAFDEAYYWLWSKDLAFGYYDHPPMIAFVIRAGTLVFGDTPFGLRFALLLLSIAATWAVWRSARILTGCAFTAVVAALLFNLTLMVGTQALAATPDAPALATSAFFFFALAKVSETGRGRWWLVAGAVAGLGMLSKYTMPMLGTGALLWVVMVPKQRHWFSTPWPYLGALVCLLLFLPNLLWNAGNDWMSIAKQFGRVGSDDGFSLRTLGDFVAVQAALATPFIAVLMVVGLARLFVSDAARQSRLALAGWLVLPSAVYFLWHSLHGRVEGNWPSFLYPMLCVAAAVVMTPKWDASESRLTRLSRALAVPVAFAMTAIVYLQALTGIVPLSPDPLARLVGGGYADFAAEVDALRVREGAAFVLTSSHTQTGWLSFYLPSRPPVIQIDDRWRWPDQIVPDVQGPLLYVTPARRDKRRLLEPRFDDITQIGRLTRRWNGREIEDYLIYRVFGAPGPLFGNEAR